MTDFHTHILPGIDDGSKNVDMSVQMIDLEKEQGVDTIVATPHFNFEHEDLGEFLEKRQKAADALKKALGSKYEIKLLLGAEVAVSPGISTQAGLEKLCIEGTKCILLEMPMNDWTGWVFNEIYAVTARNLTPIMAHVERYYDIAANREKIDTLTDMEVCIQINAASVGRIGRRKIINKLLKSNKPVVIGSDTHNLTDRKPNIQHAIHKISRKYGQQFTDRLENNARLLLKGNYAF